MINITLLGKPRSTNNIYKTICRGNFPSRYLSAEGKSLKESYSLQAKMQYKDEPMEGELMVSIRMYHSNKRKNDWDNFHKLSMDSLTGIVWVDDSQIEQAMVTKYIDKNNPRIEIEVEHL